MLVLFIVLVHPLVNVHRVQPPFVIPCTSVGSVGLTGPARRKAFEKRRFTLQFSSWRSHHHVHNKHFLSFPEPQYVFRHLVFDV